MRLLFTRHLLVGMNEKCARCNFDLLNFESFRSKRPIELINVQVSVILRIWNDIPKRPNSFLLGKAENNYFRHLREFPFALFHVFSIGRFPS